MGARGELGPDAAPNGWRTPRGVATTRPVLVPYARLSDRTGMAVDAARVSTVGCGVGIVRR